MHPVSVRDLATSLRRKGYSYPYISEKTGLSKSTLSSWLSDIPYEPNSEMVSLFGKALAAANQRKGEIRREQTKSTRQQASAELGNISKRDLFLFGLGLYLGEGSKTHDITRIVNADAKVIRIATAWFQSLGVRNEQFLLTLHLYPDNDILKSQEYWSKESGIPLSQFGKTQIDTRKKGKVSNLRKLPNGTAHLSVRSLGRKEFGVILARKIRAWTDLVAEVVANAELV